MYDPSIVCCFLHPITKYGYPPAAGSTPLYLSEMAEIGFSSVELEGIHEHHLTEVYGMRMQIADVLSRLDLAVPYFCVVLPGLSSSEADVRKHNLDLFEKGCEIAKSFGALGVLDNAPIPPYQFPEGIPVTRHYDADVLRNATIAEDLDWPRYWYDLASTFRQACDLAAEHGLTYQIHPCDGALSSTSDAFLLFRNAVDRDNLRFNFDTANLFALKDNLSLALRRTAPWIDYIHLSDNRGMKVEHLVPGNGVIDWDGFFKTLQDINFDGHLGVDVGGAESNVENIDEAYTTTANWISARWPR